MDSFSFVNAVVRFFTVALIPKRFDDLKGLQQSIDHQ